MSHSVSGRLSHASSSSASSPSRRAAIAGFAAAAVFAGSVGFAGAQDVWPQRPIKMIVSQSAGASPDVFARLLGEKLHGILKQSIVVENKPGAGNAIGAQAAANAAPDGYTFFFATSAAMTMNPFLLKDLPYDPLKDFVPVALVTRSHQVLVAHPSFPANTLPELISVIKNEPGKHNVVIDGPRNLSGVIVRILKSRAGLDFTEIPYTNIPLALQDVVSGRVPIGIFSLSVAEGQLRGGNLKAIAGASAQGIASMPKVDPVAKFYPDFDYLGWFMVVAPKGTPDAIINRMHDAIAVALKDPGMIEAAPKLGFEIDPNGVGTSVEAAAFLRRQLELWRVTTEKLGLRPE